jgi:Flp pilus assembly protein TadG
MRLRPAWRKRRGTTLPEAALVTTVFLTLCLGMLDLSLGIFHYNTLSQAARQLSRQAAVHGSYSSSPWGTTTYGPVAASDTGTIASTVRSYLVGMDPSAVTVTVSWPDSSNAPDQDSRVQVTLSTSYTPMLTFIFGSPSLTLSATSTVRIAH